MSWSDWWDCEELMSFDSGAALLVNTSGVYCFCPPYVAAGDADSFVFGANDDEDARRIAICCNQDYE